METARAIAKDLLYPYLDQDVAFGKEPPEFWDSFLKGLSGYEQDPKPVFAAIYRLKLLDPEKIIQRLPVIYDRFLEGLAEQYVLGNDKVIQEFPWLQKKGLFREKVSYFQDLKSAMAKVERESFFRELPAAYAALSEEISEEDINRAIARNEREYLREKFVEWDRELEEEEKVIFHNFSQSLNINYYKPREEMAAKEERKETLLLPEKATPPERSVKSGYIWIAVIAALVLWGILGWLLFK